jgi:hypothetical protein
MKAIRTILHPTDFSTSSQYALEMACMLAREQKARLVLLHEWRANHQLDSGPTSTPRSVNEILLT